MRSPFCQRSDRISFSKSACNLAESPLFPGSRDRRTSVFLAAKGPMISYLSERLPQVSWHVPEVSSSLNWYSKGSLGLRATSGAGTSSAPVSSPCLVIGRFFLLTQTTNARILALDWFITRCYWFTLVQWFWLFRAPAARRLEVLADGASIPKRIRAAILCLGEPQGGSK